MSSDPLSDFLHLTEAESVVSGGFVAGGEWALCFPAPRQLKFFAVVKGSGWLRLDGWTDVVRFGEGDVVLLSGRDGFVAANSTAARPLDARRVFPTEGGRIAQVGVGSEFSALAGGVSLHPSSAAVVTDVLPPLVHVPASHPRAASLRWIVRELDHERRSTWPGTEVASAQLAQLLFVQILRAHLASSGDDRVPAGWFRAMRDERIAQALRCMHEDPARAWSVNELARAAAMSRTSFATRFKSISGTTPLAYLTEWRMRLAQRTLRDEDAAVSEIACQFGYASESAFSHAFKRCTGMRPRDYRAATRAQDRQRAGRAERSR